MSAAASRMDYASKGVNALGASPHVSPLAAVNVELLGAAFTEVSSMLLAEAVVLPTGTAALEASNRRRTHAYQTQPSSLWSVQTWQ